MFEFYGPTSPEVSRSRVFTFIVRDKRLRASVVSSTHSGLGKYLMRSTTRDVNF